MQILTVRKVHLGAKVVPQKICYNSMTLKHTGKMCTVTVDQNGAVTCFLVMKIFLKQLNWTTVYRGFLTSSIDRPDLLLPSRLFVPFFGDTKRCQLYL